MREDSLVLFNLRNEEKVKVIVLTNSASSKSGGIQLSRNSWQGKGLTCDSDHTRCLFNYSLTKLRNIPRQVNFNYLILRSNMQFCHSKNFWVRRSSRTNSTDLIRKGADPRNLPSCSGYSRPVEFENNIWGIGAFKCWGYPCSIGSAEYYIETNIEERPIQRR